MFPAIKSDLITGPVIVGVRHNLPFEGVSLLLGNDLAGIKVVAEHIVTNEPAVDAETSDLACRSSARLSGVPVSTLHLAVHHVASIFSSGCHL
jgi:hypothetical protein